MKSFTSDMKEALTSGERLLKAYPHALLSVCHGTEVTHALTEFEKAQGFEEIL